MADATMTDTTMTAPHPTNYTIFCVVLNENRPFSVEVPRDVTVDQLRKSIKAEMGMSASYANNLTLYLVNTPDDDNLTKNLKQKLTVQPPLRATNALSALFPEAPAKNTIHILVRPLNIGK
jgi:hypothetical protein